MLAVSGCHLSRKAPELNEFFLLESRVQVIDLLQIFVEFVEDIKNLLHP